MSWFRSRPKPKAPVKNSVHRSKYTEESEFTKEVKKEIQNKKEELDDKQRRPNHADGS